MSCVNKAYSDKKQAGFTLVELAIVLLIVGIMLSSVVNTLSSRIETTRRENTVNQLEEIKVALLGYASAKGRLPCPTTTTGGGEEQPVTGGACTLQHGFVPGNTLGLSGAYNRDGLLIDAWNNPIRYSVTNNNANAFTTDDAIGTGMRDVGMSALNPDLYVCSEDSPSGSVCSAGTTLTNNVPFIILSLGNDGSDFVTNTAPNSDQGENAGEIAVAVNAAGENLAYTVGNNRVFVSKNFSQKESTEGQFDDLVVWVSPYTLYSRMIEAGQLP